MYQKGFFRYSFVVIIFVMISACANKFNDKENSSNQDFILLNQIAYAPNVPKIALIRSNSKQFSILDENGKTVLKKATSPVKYAAQSGDSVQQINFSELIKPGKYFIRIKDSIYSHPMQIKAHPYSEIAKQALKSFYFNRSGMPMQAKYAGKWSRSAGHPDTIVYVHASAASKQRPEGTIISSPKGWYDAGDYNKYIVNSSISTYTLLLAYQVNPCYFKNLDLNIPESNDKIPDIINEALYNLRWMMSMQDPNDGGVYHKLSTKSFEGFVMPKKATNKRYVVQKSTAAALDFAATMAYSSLILREFSNELPDLADSCLMQAQKAWKWAKKNPDQYYLQPKDISTGEYGDQNLNDEWFWAASELMIATQSLEYEKSIQDNNMDINTPTWNKVNTLGAISLLLNGNNAESDSIKTKFLDYINQLLVKENKSPLRIAIDDFNWGSNSDFANQGMLKMIAYHLTHKAKYADAAQESLDYLLGRNATGYCFVTGFGAKSPRNIHHRISASDKVAEPIPGLLVGGPNLIVPDDCGTNVTRSEYPAKSYEDMQCSYSTNEIAINWNAPFVFLTSSVDASENIKN